MKLSSIWPFSRIYAWLEWRRRDREEILIGAASYHTTWTSFGSPTGDVSQHHVRFLMDGNGVRYAKIDHGPLRIDAEAANEHSKLQAAIFNWKHFGDLPEHVRRPDNRPRGKLVLLDGGAA